MPNPPTAGLPNAQSYDTMSLTGVVIDLITGLQWQQTVDESTFTCRSLSTVRRPDARRRWMAPALTDRASIGRRLHEPQSGHRRQRVSRNPLCAFLELIDLRRRSEERVERELRVR